MDKQLIILNILKQLFNIDRINFNEFKYRKNSKLLTIISICLL